MKIKKSCKLPLSIFIILFLLQLFPLASYYGCPSNTSNIIAVVGKSDFQTIIDDLEELVSKGKIKGYDYYTESNIDSLWTHLSQYKILLIDEDCMFDWENPGPDYNRPTPVLPIGVSFYNHKRELLEWIYNGGGLFSTDQNDISLSYTNDYNTWWTWLPDELQVESNQYPSNYPTIGYGHDPKNLEVVYDPWIFSTPNIIDITKVNEKECHGRFTKYPGYTPLVRDKSNGDVLEIFRYYGKGVIVLSHVEYETADPFDVDYVENEINFIRPERKNIELKLYIEDAITGRREGSPPIVNKAPGDTIDIVMQIANKEDESYKVKALIEVPSNLIYMKCFSRNGFTDIEEKPLTPSVIGGKYEVNITLGKKGSKESDEQIVWRFRIPDNERTNICPLILGTVKINNTICDESSASYSMAQNVKAIIIANRYLLFTKYGDLAGGSSEDVKDLLNYLYQIADWRDHNCIIYYVDHEDESLKNWNQNVDYRDESTANEVANRIDKLIEKWARKTKPPYLMIVGGDEIIPFYRVRDPVGDERAHAYNSEDPVKNMIDNGYFPTDNVYADTDGRDWDRGKLELGCGRIVGCSARDMKNLIRNGLEGPSASSNAVVASRSAGSVRDVEPDPPAHIVNVLRQKKLNILNDDEIPSTIENEDWREEDLRNALQRGFRTFTFLDHGNYWGIETPDGDLLADEIDDVNSNNCITNNRPLIVIHACRVGLVTDEGLHENTGRTWDPMQDDCMVYAFVHSGVCGMVASTALAYTDRRPDEVGYGEKLVNDFYYVLMRRTTEGFGSVLRIAKRDYNHGWLWDGQDEKTMIEYTLYGVPWATMDPEESEGTNTSGNIGNSGVMINISKPLYVSPGVYSRIVEIKVLNYAVKKVDNFDLLTINGSELACDAYKPVVPTVHIPIFFPQYSNISDIKAVNITYTSIGYYNIPSFMPAVEISRGAEGGYTNQTDVVGFYPSPIYSVDVNYLKEYTQALISFGLIQYNPQTKETLLYNYIKVQLIYQAPVTVVATDFSAERTRYICGEVINTLLTLENIGSDALRGLQVNLSLKDPHGIVKASTSMPFDILAGESKTIYPNISQSLSHGSYLLEASIISGSNVLGQISTYVYITSGEIVDFSIPNKVKPGDDFIATVKFKNGYPIKIRATGLIYIYDQHNIEVGELYSVPIDIAPNSIGIINISWSTVGREIGRYEASAVVFVDEEAFGPVYRGFSIIAQILGDINGDGIVDYKDLAIMCSCYDTKAGDPNFRSEADLNNDGYIDYKDLAILISNYGRGAS